MHFASPPDEKCGLACRVLLTLWGWLKELVLRRFFTRYVLRNSIPCGMATNRTDTINFPRETRLSGSSASMHLVER